MENINLKNYIKNTYFATKGLFEYKNLTAEIKKIIEINNIDYPNDNVQKLVRNTINELRKTDKRKILEIDRGRLFFVTSSYEQIKWTKILSDGLNNSKISTLNDQFIEIIEKITLDQYLENLFLLKNILKEEAISSNTIEGNTIKTLKDFDRRSKIKEDPEVKIIQQQFNIIEKINQEDFFRFSEENPQFSLHNLLSVHQGLFSLQDWKNFHGTSGNLKSRQNYLDTGYLPPNSDESKIEIICWLEVFNQKIDKNKLIHRAIFLHLWFEAIHPFDDGNGRIGRLLFSYYFMFHKVTNKLLINVSVEINNQRKKYMDGLSEQNLLALSEVMIEGFINEAKIKLENYAIKN